MFAESPLDLGNLFPSFTAIDRVFQMPLFVFRTSVGAGLPESPHRPLVERYMGGRASGILSFGVGDGREAGARFIDALRLIVRLVNIGDAKTLVIHPSSTTHQQLSAEEQVSAGVSPDLVRVSVGTEHIDDIKADLDQALRAVS